MIRRRAAGSSGTNVEVRKNIGSGMLSTANSCQCHTRAAILSLISATITTSARNFTIPPVRSGAGSGLVSCFKDSLNVSA